MSVDAGALRLLGLVAPPPPEEEEEEELAASTVDRGALKLLGLDRAPSTLPPAPTLPPEEKVAQEPDTAVQRQGLEPTPREYVPSASLVQPAPPEPGKTYQQKILDYLNPAELGKRAVGGTLAFRDAVGEAIGQAGVDLEAASGKAAEEGMALGRPIFQLGESVGQQIQTMFPPDAPPLQAPPALQPTREANLADSVAESLPNFLGIIGSTVAGGPAAGLAVAGASEWGNQYRGARERGASEEEAKVSATIYSGAAAALEYTGAAKALEKALPGASKNALQDLAARWLAGAAAEGATETAQELTSELVDLATFAGEKGFGVEDLQQAFSKENLRRYGRAGVVGFILGGGPALTSAGKDAPAPPPTPQPAPPAEVGERVSASPEDAVEAVAPEEVPLPPEEEGTEPRRVVDLQPMPAPPERFRDLRVRRSQPTVREELTREQRIAADEAAEAQGPPPGVAEVPAREEVEAQPEVQSIRYERLGEERPPAPAQEEGVEGEAPEAPPAPQPKERFTNFLRRTGRELPKYGSEEHAELVREWRGEEAPPEPAVVSSPGEGGFAKIASTPEQRLPPYEFENPETEERYREALKGAQQPSLLTRARESLRATGRAFSREHVLIPHGAFHAPVRESLRRVAASPEVSVDRVALALHESISPLASEEYDLFLRSSLVENLQGVKEVYGPDTPIPFGFDEASLSEESSRLEGQLAANPKVQQARDAMRQTWTEVRQETRDAFEAANLPTDFLDSQGDAYLHHQILEYASLDPKAGGKLRSPTGRGFQRALKGSEKDFNLRYAQAQGRVMSQLLVDAELARQLVNIRKKYSDPVKTEAKKAAKKAGDTRSWKEHIPEGYGIWQPREGSHFFMGQSVTERLASEIMTKGVKEVSGQDLREMMMVGGRREEYVLPQEIIDTLEHAGRRIDNDMLRGLVRGNEKLQRGWKVWQLLQPRRQVKYLTRNIVGDGSKVLSGNPSTYRHGNISTAAKELASSLYGKRSQVSPDLAAWKLRGGLSSGLFQQEIEASEAERLRRLVESPRFQASLKDLAASPKKLGQMYWTKTRQNAKFLESLLRYATFRDYLRQIKADPEGKPKNYGASIAAEIDALEDPNDKAYWLSNELIGAYDMVSAGGQFLRRELLPFWSFQELNVRSHYRLMRNALRDDRVAGSFARKAGITTARYGAMGALRAGKFLALAYALEVMLHAWNHAFFPDEEEELSAFIKKSPHIIFGRRENGEILYFNRLGVWNEFREWFGIDEFGMSVVEYLNGRKSPKEVALDTALPVVDKAVSTIGGLGLAGSTKMLMEGLTRTSTFPSATRPSRIPDVPDWLARSFGVEHEFRALTDRPMPTGGKTSSERWARSVPEAFLYSQDPGSAAYYDILNLKDRYLRHIGEEGGGYSWSARSSALRNYKRAIRFDEPDLAEKYLFEYAALGGTQKGLAQSLERLHPLAGLKKEHEEGFLEWIDDEEEAILARALDYYDSVLLREGRMPFDEDEIFWQGGEEYEKRKAKR